MPWQDYRNISDLEIGLLKKEDGGRSLGFDEVCRLAMKKNAAHPLHNESVDICAAHLSQYIIRHNLQDAEGYEVTYGELKIANPAYKAMVRKAFTSPNGIRYKGRNLFFK